ncbi:MAG TPA: hypothetical protein VIJ39_09575 [Solirubrobacteraceae bacterium]
MSGVAYLRDWVSEFPWHLRVSGLAAIFAQPSPGPPPGNDLDDALKDHVILPSSENQQGPLRTKT